MIKDMTKGTPWKLKSLWYLTPMVFELIARALVIYVLFDSMQFIAICISDPAAWVSALIPLIPYYYWFMNKKLKMSGVSDTIN